MSKLDLALLLEPHNVLVFFIIFHDLHNQTPKQNPEILNKLGSPQNFCFRINGQLHDRLNAVFGNQVDNHKILFLFPNLRKRFSSMVSNTLFIGERMEIGL